MTLVPVRTGSNVSIIDYGCTDEERDRETGEWRYEKLRMCGKITRQVMANASTKSKAMNASLFKTTP